MLVFCREKLLSPTNETRNKQMNEDKTAERRNEGGSDTLCGGCDDKLNNKIQILRNTVNYLQNV